MSFLLEGQGEKVGEFEVIEQTGIGSIASGAIGIFHLLWYWINGIRFSLETRGGSVYSDVWERIQVASKKL